MKNILVLILIFGITGCASDKGLLELQQISYIPDKVVILRDEPTRELVLPILVEWFAENNRKASVIYSLNEVKPEEHVLSYRAWWGWDLATYMRAANLKVKLQDKTLAKLRFSALEYGGFGKFGDTEKRLKILLDVLFGKITRDEANKRLGEQ